MTRTERLVLALGVWLAVYPTVTLISYLLEDLDWPLPAMTLLTTALTVPLITFAVVPAVKAVMARVERKPELAED